MIVFIAWIVDTWVDTGVESAASFHGGVVAGSVNWALAARTASDSIGVDEPEAESAKVAKTSVDPLNMLSPIRLFDKDTVIRATHSLDPIL
jgi:hypothetical protein